MKELEIVLLCGGGSGGKWYSRQPHDRGLWVQSLFPPFKYPAAHLLRISYLNNNKPRG